MQYPTGSAPSRRTPAGGRSTASGPLFAKIGADHIAIAHYILWNAVRDLDPVIENNDAIRNRHDCLHMVFDQNDGDAVLPDPLDQRAGAFHFGRIEAAHRLV